MKKILLILNEIRSPADILDYTIGIAQANQSFLEGVFLKRSEHVVYQYPFPNDFPLTEVEGSEKEARKEDKQLLIDYIRLFKDRCEAAGIGYEIVEHTNNDLTQLIHYSLFADCIIADARIDLDEYSLQDVLVDAHCPVILIKSGAKPTEKVVLTYDGSASSMQAIKMYSYLFPDCRQLPVHLVSVNTTNERELKYSDEIKSWSSLHFTRLETHVLSGDVKTELVQFIQQQREPVMVVIGAFGRTALSRMLHKSLATALLDNTIAALFITHQ